MLKPSFLATLFVFCWRPGVSGCDLECLCTAAGGVYAEASQSCLVYDSVAREWWLSFKHCQDLASDSFESINAFGRLVHIDTDQMAHTVFNAFKEKEMYIGLRANADFNSTTLGPCKYYAGSRALLLHVFDICTASLDDYVWWLNIHNSNARKPVNDLANVTDKQLSDPSFDCVKYVTTSANYWLNVPCNQKKPALCEIIADECQVSNPCDAPNECIPDSQQQTLCVCPDGAPDDTECGVNCTGKPDGLYHLGTCRKDYYSCDTGVATLEECDTGAAFDSFHKNCSDTTLECECLELGWKYMSSTQSCYMMHLWYAAWNEKFRRCLYDATGYFSTPHLYGRLVHVNSAQIAATALDVGENAKVSIGMRGAPGSAGNTTSVGDFKWWLDRENSNAVDEVEQPNYIATVNLDGPNDDCVIYETDVHNRWDDFHCSYIVHTYLMCEIFQNQCEISNPCVPPKVCVPDVSASARCFCPGGAVNTNDCTDCTDKPDGNYPIAPCNSHYYTCTTGVSTTYECANGTAFDRSTGICSAVSLECECAAIGGKYLPERMTCVWNKLVYHNWFQGFEYCKAKASEMGVPLLSGRLAHVNSLEIATAMFDMYRSYQINWIAMRVVNNGTGLGDFHWWYDNENSNAVTPITMPAEYMSHVTLDNSIPCTLMKVDINSWEQRDCGTRSHMSTACEFLENQCDVVANPCPKPKVCLPDINKTTKCFCPAGAINDDLCGTDCSGKPNGDYPVATCSKDYYTCTNGVSSPHECPHNETFDSYSNTCGNNSLECRCVDELGGFYIPTRKSCVASSLVHENAWYFSYKRCISKAEQSQVPHLHGRLAHIDDSAIANAMEDHFVGVQALFGLRALDNASDIADYKWWFDPDNRNAVLDINETSRLTLSMQNYNYEKCPHIYLHTMAVLPTSCATRTHFYSACEFFQNEQCAVANDCVAPRECYPDINGQRHCFCPAGAVNDPNCGVDCTAKPDGHYGIGSSTSHYYSCLSGTPAMHECSAGEIFNLYLEQCSPKNISLRLKCMEQGGIFESSSSSCLTVTYQVGTTWRQAYEACGTEATSFGIDGLFGRLAHLDTVKLLNTAMDVANDKLQKIGMRSKVKGQSTSYEDFVWWLDLHNSNAFKQVEDFEGVKSQELSDPDKDCAVYYSNTHNKLVNQRCSSGPLEQDLCQIFYNQCDKLNPCTAPKVCVPDSHGQRECFCPNGATNDDTCGVNCTGKADGNYRIGACSRTYYSCTSGTSSIVACPWTQVFDPLNLTCADTALECKCIELGGQYVTSTQSCLMRHNSILQNWFAWSTECENVADTFGVNGVKGRLVQIRDKQMAASVLDSQYIPSRFTGMRANSPSNATVLSHYYWWFDAHNHNAMLPVTDVLNANTYLQDPTLQCGMYTPYNSVNKEVFETVGCPHKANDAICEILYDVCQISNPCPLSKQCYPDGDFDYQCFCPAGAPNDSECGVDCTNKADGQYAIGNNHQHYYSCDNGAVTVESCVDGEVFDKIFKLCASDSVTSKCMSLGGKFVDTSDSCVLIAIDQLAQWHHAFEYCQNFALEHFGLGHRGRLVHMKTDDVASAVADLKDAYLWTALRTELNNNDINDYSWWNYADTSNNSTAVSGDLTRLTLVTNQYITDVSFQCITFHPTTFAVHDAGCTPGKTGVCEIFYDPELEPENTCLIEQPCLNNGNCIERVPIDGFYYCECSIEYTGQNCTDPNICLLESPCANGANCTDGPGEEYSCACAPEMLDKNCSVTDWCYLDPCANGASCYIEQDSYKCNCTHGWLLPNCIAEAPSCPPRTNLECNQTSCFCVAVRPRNTTDRAEYRSIGRDIKGTEGITVQTHSRLSSTHCAMMCGRVPQCSFFSFKHATSECLLNNNIAPAFSEPGFVMFAKIY